MRRSWLMLFMLCTPSARAGEARCPAPGETKEQYCAKADPCDVRCLERVETYFIEHSNYNVAGTLGNGEHQGLGVALVEELIDTRGKPSRVCKRDRYRLAYLFNHGRTVNTQPKKFRVASQLTLRTDNWEYAKGAGNPTYEISWSIYNAVQAVAQHDGYCDGVCANDGYAIPWRALGQRQRDCSQAVFTPMDAFPDACRRTTRWGWGAGRRRVVSPTWGHNSNNDATAELDHFARIAQLVKDADNLQKSALVGGKRKSVEAWVTELAGGANGVCAGSCNGDPSGNAPACSVAENIARTKVTWCDGCMNLGTKLQGDVDTSQNHVNPAADCYGRNGAARCAGCGFAPGKIVKGF
jgi:hypothetical protein